MEIRVYLTNLAKYNEGRLVGKWIDLPLDTEELKKEVQAVLGSDEEYFITDYEAPFSVHEYENLRELNDFAEKLDELTESDQKKILYLIENIGCEKDYALDHYEDVTFYSGMSLLEVAEELVDDGIFGDIPESIQGYIDYNKIAKDLEMDGYHETEDGTFHYQ